MKLKGIIFDLDGVIVKTDNLHYIAWKKVADIEGIYFDREINERLRGVSRMESLEIILEKSKKSYTEDEKENIANLKNNIYKQLIEELSFEDILPGVNDFLRYIKHLNIKTAIGSLSKNTIAILNALGYNNFFDAVADGTMIKKSKPDPEVFLLAAQKLNLSPHECAVIEDAEAGIKAAKNGGFYAVATGQAVKKSKADLYINDLSDKKIYELFI